MEQYVGIDVSLEWSSVCVMDRAGTVLRETKVASAPEPLVAFVRSLDGPVAVVGMEQGRFRNGFMPGCTTLTLRRC